MAAVAVKLDNIGSLWTTACRERRKHERGLRPRLPWPGCRHRDINSLIRISLLLSESDEVLAKDRWTRVS